MPEIYKIFAGESNKTFKKAKALPQLCRILLHPIPIKSSHA